MYYDEYVSYIGASATLLQSEFAINSGTPKRQTVYPALVASIPPRRRDCRSLN